jgi:L-rhamnose mutarotase
MRSEALKKAQKKWEEKQVVLGCKVKKEVAEEILRILKEKGYKNYSEYLKALIKRDSGIDV